VEPLAVGAGSSLARHGNLIEGRQLVGKLIAYRAEHQVGCRSSAPPRSCPRRATKVPQRLLLMDDVFRGRTRVALAKFRSIVARSIAQASTVLCWQDSHRLQLAKKHRDSHRMVAPRFRFSHSVLLLSGSLCENPDGRKKQQCAAETPWHVCFLRD
jgi:hypothetical protein